MNFVHALLQNNQKFVIYIYLLLVVNIYNLLPVIKIVEMAYSVYCVQCKIMMIKYHLTRTVFRKLDICMLAFFLSIYNNIKMT